MLKTFMKATFLVRVKCPSMFSWLTLTYIGRSLLKIGSALRS